MQISYVHLPSSCELLEVLLAHRTNLAVRASLIYVYSLLYISQINIKHLKGEMPLLGEDETPTFFGNVSEVKKC